MSLKQQLDKDIKTALLGGNKVKAEVLKSLKSAILYEEVAKKARDRGLDDAELLIVFAREAKKRSESAELYRKAGEVERAQKEESEKAIIDLYLPKQLSDAELEQIVSEIIAKAGADPQIGKVIGLVRSKVGPLAEGGRIAAVVKTKLG